MLDVLRQYSKEGMMDQPGEQDVTRAILNDFSNALDNVGTSGEGMLAQDEQHLNELGQALAGRSNIDVIGGLYDEYRDVRRKANQVSWEPGPEMIDDLHFYPWLNEVSPQTEDLYKNWSSTRELPKGLLEQVPEGEIGTVVGGWVGSIEDVAQKAPNAALGLLNKLVDFIDAGWKAFKEKLSSVRFGIILDEVRVALAAVARAVSAAEFALQIGTSGISYQFNFVVQPQNVGETVVYGY